MKHASPTNAAASDAIRRGQRDNGHRGDAAVGVRTDRVPVRPAGSRNERGMVSAEWAVGLIAAISIAGVLIGVLTSPAVREALLAVVLRIINFISGISIPG